MKQKLKMIWRILRDKQVVVITEDHGRMYKTYDKCLNRRSFIYS